MGVAFPARGALKPNDVASGVEDHKDISRRRSDAKAGEVLTATLSKAGDNRATEPGSPERSPAPGSSQGGQRVNTEGVAVEPEVEEIGGGFVGRE